MGTKNKTFDCVEMKTRIQQAIMAEYEAEKDRWPSFVDFIKSRNERSDVVHNIRNRLHDPSRDAS